MTSLQPIRSTVMNCLNVLNVLFIMMSERQMLEKFERATKSYAKTMMTIVYIMIIGVILFTSERPMIDDIPMDIMMNLHM